MLNRLQYRVLIIFLSFILIIILTLIIHLFYVKQKNNLELVHHQILSINNQILNNINVISNFFTYETKNPDFFITGKSNFLDQHQINIDKIRKDVVELKQLKSVEQFNILEKAELVQKELNNYEDSINHMVTLLLQRGYKDYGTEGNMRSYIHKLEAIKSIDLTKVLMLRRHEKDYIIRDEEKYVKLLSELGKEFKNEIIVDQKINLAVKDSALYFLDQYLKLFDQMVMLDKAIGNKSNSALTQMINNQQRTLIQICDDLNQETIIQKKDITRKIRMDYIAVIAIILVLSIILSFYLSKKITFNISILSDNISKFVKHNFATNVGDDFPKTYPKDEVGLLIGNYLILRKEIINLIHNFQAKVDQRTEAILCQKERIKYQKEEIEVQRDEVFRQNKLIEFQKKRTEQQNKDIIASIEYAKLIQDALFPSEKTLNRYFPDHFILYKPKDIISGDFYWTKRIINNGYDISLLAAVDCTGHGVPGAMMSMLGIAFLNEIVLRREVQRASHVLDMLREKIIESLQSYSNGKITNDGMDIALVMFDHTTHKLHYAGANRPLYMVRQGNLQIVKGDKMPIGKHGISKGNFSDIEIELQENDCFYIFTDGYADQFGGEKNKKYKRQRFRHILLKNFDKSMLDQKQNLELEHQNWKGNNKQTDDILVIGVRYKKSAY